MKKIVHYFLPFLFTLLLDPSIFLKIQAQQHPIEEKEAPTQGRSSLRVSIEQVQVNVTVMNKKKDLIQGLQKQHFKIYEEKIEQEIINFYPIEAPITAVLITEFSKAIPWEYIYEAWIASHSFVDQMRAEDWIAVVAYDIRPEILVDFTQNKEQVYGSLAKLNYPAFLESNLYDTVYDVLDRVQEMEERVAIILVSSGIDTFSKINLKKTMNKVKNSNVVIYSVSLGGNLRARREVFLPGAARLDLYQGDATLRYFSKYTGGEAFFPRFVQQYKSIFQNISNALRNQYSLSYASSNPKKDGKYRKIKVEVYADANHDGKPEKLKVRHREGYLSKKREN